MFVQETVATQADGADEMQLHKLSEDELRSHCKRTVVRP
jgi:hypothetical protein